MQNYLKPYGCADRSASVAKVGSKNKTPRSLAARMPSGDIAAKVGIATMKRRQTCRVIRRKAEL